MPVRRSLLRSLLRSEAAGGVVLIAAAGLALAVANSPISDAYFAALHAPLAEVLRYSNDLRSFTQGRGVYTMRFSHYATVPSHIAQEIIAKLSEELAGQRT